MNRSKRRVYAILASGLLLAAGALGFALPAQAEVTNPDGVAVIIGNGNYGKGIPPVEYAHRDAEAMRRYVVETLGYDPENVIDLRDATKAELEGAFGNERSHKGKIWRYVDPGGKSDVLVFYSGHGVPGMSDRRGYILPSNGHPDSVEINGFALDTLYKNLLKIKTRSVTVLLDACFSGESPRGMLIKRASSIMITPTITFQQTKKRAKGAKRSKSKISKLTLLTAASGGQLASWDDEAKHGLFTRHFLDGAYGGADANKDGKVTVGEMQIYLDRTMTRVARRKYGRDQKATVVGARDHVLVRVSARPSGPLKAKIVGAPTSTATVTATATANATATGNDKSQITAATAPVKMARVNPATESARSTATPAATPTAGNLDGNWTDDALVRLTIKGGLVRGLLILDDADHPMEGKISATGELEIIANIDQSLNWVFIKGTLNAMEIDFAGPMSGRSYRSKMRRDQKNPVADSKKSIFDQLLAVVRPSPSPSPSPKSANPAAGSPDGVWIDNQLVQLTITGNLIKGLLILDDGDHPLEGKISASGEINIIANIDQSLNWVFIKGTLNDLNVDFAGPMSIRSYRTKMRRK